MNVLITFYSLNGETEQLALAAAVGAVQGRANIRLRRLPLESNEEAREDLPEYRENAQRMQREYVAPQKADALWADALIFGMPARLSPSSPACAEYLRSLDAAGMKGKNGALFVSNATPAAGAAESLHRALTELGLQLVPLDSSVPDNVDSVRLLGRIVAELGSNS